jgi:outer membrane receptor protein involved in Fe transport
MNKRHKIKNYAFLRALICLLFLLPGFSGAAEPRAGRAPMFPRPGWSFPLQGAFSHQFDTGIDNNGGTFSVDRLFLQGGVAYTTKTNLMVSVNLGYGYDGYNFSGETGFAALRPWKDIDTFRVSTPILWGLDHTWTVFVIPSARFAGESGVDLGDGAHGGLFLGAAYRVGRRLTIGPGIGVVTQIEADASVFPVLLIDWKITDSLSLGTGRGLGATLGPGLFLNWAASDRWRVALGGRYEKFRFRLNEDGIAPNGVGEDFSLPILAGIVYRLAPQIQASLMGGVELEGTLQLDDEKGNEIAKEDYDTAGFAGFMLSVRF